MLSAERCVNFKIHGVQSCYCSERSQQLGASGNVLGAIFFLEGAKLLGFFPYDNCHSPPKKGTVAGACFIGASVLVALQRVCSLIVSV